jgi:hypothetical protein
MYFIDSHPSVALLLYLVDFEIYISPPQILPEASVRRLLCPGSSNLSKKKKKKNGGYTRCRMGEWLYPERHCGGDQRGKLNGKGSEEWFEVG